MARAAKALTIDAATEKAQADASNPRASAWVSANAGSGKTHVLVNRVLRLLLDGVAPGRMLCITYTKAAAANMANRVTFCAADEDSAKIAADTLGKRRGKRRTVGYSAGRRTTSVTDEDKYVLEPFELRKLRKFEAVVQHCDHGFRKVTIPPLGTDGLIPAWYRA